jgi:prepilin-type N-terminal cleavage/methylation domain-containing protein
MSRFTNHPRRPPAIRVSAGFTIIEVLVVLAIAGLMLLLVFEALPALQRNSRNNQRRQDVQTILAAVSHYELNDSGNFPANCGNLLPSCTTPVGASNDKFLRYVAQKLSYYTNNQVVARSQSARATPGPNPNSSPDTVYIFNYQKCQSTGGSSTWQGAGYSDIVALYAIESGSSAAPQCQQL